MMNRDFLQLLLILVLFTKYLTYTKPTYFYTFCMELSQDPYLFYELIHQ